MPNHDGVYRHLFAHPQLMRELLLDFTPFARVADVPVGCFQRLNGSYTTDHGHRRHSDLVWRIQHADTGLDMFVLVECQATPDKWMALRMQVYSALLYQDLLASKALDGARRLPPVVPIVLYHGDRPWRASGNLADLIEPTPWLPARWRPRHHHVLIDQRRLAPAALAACPSLLAQLFRIELCDSPQVFTNEVPRLLARLKQPGYTDLWPAVRLWLTERVKPEFRADLDIDWTEDDMAAKYPRKFETWYDYVKHEGKQEGKLEGKVEGETEGIRIALRDLASARFGAVTQPVGELIDGVSAPQAKQLISALLQAATPDEVVSRMQRPT